MLSTTIKSSVKRQFLARGLHSSSILQNKSEEVVSWSRFFQLRKQQRTINLSTSVLSALLTSSISWNFLSNVEIDPTQLIFGFDPFMIFFAGFITSGGFGFLLGPFFGNFLFKLKNKKILDEFNVKDKEFLNKIIKNRVDPSSQSFSNPVPDYYGEKILTLKGYRDWLRDCNAYKRKAKEFL